jgi:signal transduction histidine kinase
MSWSVERKWIAGGFSLALLLTGLSSWISYQNATQLIQSTAKVQKTDALLSNLTEILATLVDAESGRRGYILSGDLKERDRYEIAMQTIEPKLNQLREQAAGNAIQQQALRRLETLLAQRRSLSARSIQLYTTDPTDRAGQARLMAENQKNRHDLRQVVTTIQDTEKLALQQWVEQSKLSTHYRILIELLNTVLGFAILLGMFALLYHQLRKRQQAELERQRAEATQHTLRQEKELSELKLRFFSMVSHEFRTPLSLILGSAQLLLDEQNWTSEKKHNNLERIQTAARSMNQLLTDVLMLTRAEAGKLEFNPTLIDAESFCLNLVEDFQFCTPAVSIQFISQEYCPPARLDEKLLYSLLSNLLLNAIKYSSPGSSIVFQLSREPDAIVFQIKDQGIGIPTDAQKHLCEPFYRASNVGTISGTGLGLAVVRTCVELHRGDISIQSEVGIGTTFTVRLPQSLAIATPAHSQPIQTRR